VKPIFVTGLPRTGASMVAGFLWSCGAEIGFRVPEPRHCNFSNRAIESFALMMAPIETLQGLVETTLCPDPRFPAWLFKSRCFLQHDGIIERWLEAWPEAIWVVTKRNLNDIKRACGLTGYDREFMKDGGDLLEAMEARRLALVSKTGVRIHEVDCRHLIERNFTYMGEVLKDGGLKLGHRPSMVDRLFGGSC